MPTAPSSDVRWVVAADDAGRRLDKFLADAERLGSRGRAANALERGKVFLNDHQATPLNASQPLQEGDRVRVWHDRPGSARVRLRRPAADGPLRVVYEDDAMIVVDKPAGVLTVPLARRNDAVSIAELLKEDLARRGRKAPIVVHRIDRDTSGLVVFAIGGDAGVRLRDQFARRAVERVYNAVVHGHPTPADGEWRDRLVWDEDRVVQRPARSGESGATEARTVYKTIEAFPHAALLEVRLVSGLRNQIRCQAALHGHMLAGERQYLSAVLRERPIAFPRQALHARRLVLAHPFKKVTVELESQIPPDLVDLIEFLRRIGA
jgi:23S rRNA pseudouridine1911/1915/1917 synthase